ncbi:MAG: hypothetical protein JRG97_00495 [Deltaproteobacteria bacterium]|nr:hypothetical protein [Deltaproteobacteria bacterium]MBW2050786.1 hypothetical protein [Deltaproteobacteria bacterium]MBW2139535.1 hypothetical protein [Deltaproteobacteria bacterium]MBW2321937.1 hypothetical protein [Deltaproteobacteria bacterium]
MQVNPSDTGTKPILSDRQLFETSPFLAEMVDGGTWKENKEQGNVTDGLSSSFSFKDFRKQIRQVAGDPEAALPLLRKLRIQTLLEVARADLENRLKPHQIQAELKQLGDKLLYGAWTVAETVLRRKYVHPLILERRNIISPVAICTLSRLGSADPFYTTAPAPIFVHSRAAEFSPALKEKDLIQARRSQKEWLPARDYFLRLTSRTISYLWASDAQGNRFNPMGEDHLLDRSVLLPGPLVILFSAFEDHFLKNQPPAQALSLLRLRFSVGQTLLGQAVEAASREILLRAASLLGGRLKNALNAWFLERAKAEGLSMVSGGLLDIEKVIRFLQFKYAPDDITLLSSSPQKALNLMVRKGLVDPEHRKILSRSYTWQWFIINRLALFDRRNTLTPQALRSNLLDREIGLEGASDKTLSLMKSARSICRDLLWEGTEGV